MRPAVMLTYWCGHVLCSLQKVQSQLTRALVEVSSYKEKYATAVKQHKKSVADLTNEAEEKKTKDKAARQAAIETKKKAQDDVERKVLSNRLAELESSVRALREENQKLKIHNHAKKHAAAIQEKQGQAEAGGDLRSSNDFAAGEAAALAAPDDDDAFIKWAKNKDTHRQFLSIKAKYDQKCKDAAIALNQIEKLKEKLEAEIKIKQEAQTNLFALQQQYGHNRTCYPPPCHLITHTTFFITIYIYVYSN
jgi:DNA repair exonuclease SbcCD ATPase subunit